MNNEKRSDLLARSWDAAASLYTSELAPRFLPWIQDALNVIQQSSKELPCPGDGMSILVPCCGPGLEIPLLGQLLGYAYPVLGVDLSGGMVAIANQIIQQHGVTAPSAAAAQELPDAQGHRPMSAVVGDALHLHTAHSAKAAVVFSTFGLQQLGAKAPEALSSWVQCLAPGGLAVVLLWPSACESQGPWHAYDLAVRQQQQQQQQQAQPQPQPQQQEVTTSPRAAGGDDWESQLVPAALQVPGVLLVQDVLLQHDIHWPDLDTFWTVMTEGGPWHARRLAFGDAHMEQLKALFRAALEAQGAAGAPAVTTLQQPGPEPPPQRTEAVSAAAAGSMAAPQAPDVWRRPLLHRPTARLLVLKRTCAPLPPRAAAPARVKL